MLPELFRIGSFAVSPFGVTMVLAFVAAFFQLRSGMRRLDVGTDDDASTIVVAAGFGGILGAKIYYAALIGEWSSLFSRSGLVWYGGFLLASALILWVVFQRRLPPWRTLDAAAPALAIGYAVGRVGCLLVGDDYGRPTDLPWGVAFERGIPPSTAGNLRDLFGVDVASGIPDSQVLAVHPTQAYETLAALLIWGLGLWLLRRQPGPGVVATAVLSLLAIERFLVEFLRAKDDRMFGGFTLAQGISVGVLVLVLVIFLWRRPNRDAEPPQASDRLRRSSGRKGNR